MAIPDIGRYEWTSSSISGTPTRRLRLIGSFAVEGRLPAQVPAGKAQRLLKLLAVRPNAFLPMAIIVDALWPDARPDKAERNVAALVSRLRRSLGKEHIDGGPEGYRLICGPRLTVDLDEAERHVRAAEHNLACGMYPVAYVAATSAEQLLAAGRPLADEPDAAWVDEVRQRVDRDLRRSRACRWRAALELGDFAAAADAASAALASDPLDEDACRALMQAYRGTGQFGAALAVYERLRAALAEELGIDPAQPTKALYLAVLRGEPSTESSRAAVGRPAAAPSPLAGRDAELRELLAAWSQAISGAGRLVLVVGEPGMGKSALASALATTVSDSGALVVTTQCFEAERSLFLQPLIEALQTVLTQQTPEAVRELVGEWAGPLSELVPEISRLIGPLHYERGTPEIEHRRSLEAISAVLGGLGERRPVLLVVEELQHAGQSTVEALHFLAGHLPKYRLLVLATLSPTKGQPVIAALGDLATRIDVGPLPPEAVELLVHRSGVSVDPATLYEWTGGSPLYVTELLRHARVTFERGQRPLTVPTSLRDAVVDRIQHEGPEVELLLQVGSVLGSAFLLDDVAALGRLDVEQCARWADRALRMELLREQGATFRFASEIVRQVAYESTPKPVRVSRHRRAAKLFEGQPEAVAHHLMAAEDWAPAVEAWLVAADAAHLAFANLEADRLLTRAVHAADQSGDRRLLASVYLRRGKIRADLGRYDAARDDLTRALELAMDLGDDQLEALALEQLGWTALYARDALAAVDLASRANYLAETAVAAPRALPSAVLLLGRVRHWDGDYAAADRAYEEVLAAHPDEATTALALAHKGALLEHTDRFDEARRVLDEAIARCRSTGMLRPLLQSLFFSALARGNVGDFAGALRALDRARRLSDEASVRYYSAGIDTTMSWLWRELGHVDRARELAEQAVEAAHRGGGALELEQELHARLALADCELAVGKEDAAAWQLEAAAPFLAKPLPFRPRAHLRLLEMEARWDRSRAEALLAMARASSSVKYEALALWHLGRFEEAAQLATRTGSDLLVAQLGPPAAARAAVQRIALALPPDLRSTFHSRGRLPLLVADR